MKTNVSSELRLNIETYYGGKNQPTHPSIVAFDEPWNGYKYWMAYSPFPNGNGDEENPCIAVSNDLLFWDIPKNFLNPISSNEELGCKELKDPHILYRKDLDRIEVWFLGRVHPNIGGDGITLNLIRKYSYNGVNWSAFEVLSETEYLCPSVIWEDNKYKLWEIGYSGERLGTVRYRESDNGFIWKNMRLCTIEGKQNDWNIWHGAVSRIDNGYVFLYMDDCFCSKKLSFASSTDGICFHKCEEQLVLSKKWFSFYRPYLLKDNEMYYCFYGIIDNEGNRYISYNKGRVLCELHGIASSDVTRMKELSDHVPDTSSGLYYFRCLFKEWNRLFRGELLLINTLLMLICMYLAVPHILTLLIGIIISIAYLFRFSGKRLYLKCCCLISSVTYGFFFYCLAFALYSFLGK